MIRKPVLEKYDLKLLYRLEITSRECFTWLFVYVGKLHVIVWNISGYGARRKDNTDHRKMDTKLVEITFHGCVQVLSRVQEREASKCCMETCRRWNGEVIFSMQLVVNLRNWPLWGLCCSPTFPMLRAISYKLSQLVVGLR